MHNEHVIKSYTYFRYRVYSQMQMAAWEFIDFY